MGMFDVLRVDLVRIDDDWQGCKFLSSLKHREIMQENTIPCGKSSPSDQSYAKTSSYTALVMLLTLASMLVGRLRCHAISLSPVHTTQTNPGRTRVSLTWVRFFVV